MDEEEKLTETLSFRVSPSTKAKIRAQARRKRLKANWLIREWVLEGLAREEIKRKDR